MVENIKIKHVEMYISLCFYCKNIKNKKRKASLLFPAVKNPIISSGFNSRAQVDLIDIRRLKMGEWRYVLNYQDNLTKFCNLRALTDKKNYLVIRELMEIFNIFGAPKILQSDNGGEFRGKEFQSYFSQFWPDVELVKSSPYNPKSQGSVERANRHVKNMIFACIHRGMFDYDLKKILSHVQYVKNTSHNRILKCTPYKAMFGQDVVVEQQIEKIFEMTSSSIINNNIDDDDDNDNNNDDDDNDNDNFEIEYRNNNIEICRENANKNIKQNAEKMLSISVKI